MKSTGIVRRIDELGRIVILPDKDLHIGSSLLKDQGLFQARNNSFPNVNAPDAVGNLFFLRLAL